MPGGSQILLWIVASGILMSLIAVVGGATFFVLGDRMERFLLPLVAFSAGALIGGAFFHLIPASLQKTGISLTLFVWVLIGFSLFFALEQFLHWHHCRKAEATCKKPLTYLILFGDGLHNFIGGMAIAGTFLLDIRLGIAAWLAAAAHEIPQELGDMGVLLYGGWSKNQALVFNFLSSLTFLAGGLVVYFVSYQFDISFLIPFAAGNFIYIGATDLIPEVNKHGSLSVNVKHFLSFIIGLGFMLIVTVMFE
ncbi:MAG: ZIP family metal transporter [Pyrinomonadaceae bacterium]|nr:ZIP family metal transporter [Pyrinomonadaceae bacterium]MBP6212644.1 ZIP family metal transporter [Pyrinomonadaceae bacterium]